MTEYNPSPEDIRAYQRRQNHAAGWASSISSHPPFRSGTPQPHARYDEPLPVARSYSYNNSISTTCRDRDHGRHAPHLAAPQPQRTGSPASFNGFPPGHFGGADAGYAGGYGGQNDGGATPAYYPSAHGDYGMNANYTNGTAPASESGFLPQPSCHPPTTHSRSGSEKSISRARSHANGLKAGGSMRGGGAMSAYAGSQTGSAVPEVVRTVPKYPASPYPHGGFPTSDAPSAYFDVPGSPAMSNSSLLSPPTGFRPASAAESYRSASKSKLAPSLSSRRRFHSSRGDSPAAPLAPLQIPPHSNNGDADRLALTLYTPTVRGNDDAMALIPGSTKGDHRSMTRAKSHSALSPSSRAHAQEFQHAYGYGTHEYRRPPVPPIPGLHSYRLGSGVKFTALTDADGSIAITVLETAPGTKVKILSGSSKSKDKMSSSVGGPQIVHLERAVPKASASGKSRIDEGRNTEGSVKSKGDLSKMFAKKK